MDGARPIKIPSAPIEFTDDRYYCDKIARILKFKKANKVLVDFVTTDA